ncbi:hypothetical protein QZH41_004099 [Actinostola sp. cb2023]|nr:hypothetical protein QZH41_004099 [Actinostola sp. cb2023]
MSQYPPRSNDHVVNMENVEEELRVEEEGQAVKLDLEKSEKEDEGCQETFASCCHDVHGRISNVVNGKVASARPLERSAKNRSRLKENEYLTKVVYWAHKKYSDFKQRTYEVTSVKGKARKDFKDDIFGNEKNKELRLIDSKSEEDFDTKLYALEEIWDEREKAARKTTEPEFLKYFKSYLVRDMKEKMILPVRRNAGLKDELFYDNATESINHQFKVHVRSKKAPVNVQGVRDLDCTLAEASRIYYDMLEETRRNIQRAVIGMGHYRLAPAYAHLQVPPSKWEKLTSSQKMRRH